MTTMKPPKRLFKRPQRDDGPDGPEGLRAWAEAHREEIEAAYLAAIEAGVPPLDVIVWASPAGESLDSPPGTIAVIDRRKGEWAEGAAGVPADYRRVMENVLARRPPAGLFDVVASRSEGRFKGTFHGQARVPGAPGIESN
jgi:hypothetical protein